MEIMDASRWVKRLRHFIALLSVMGSMAAEPSKAPPPLPEALANAGCKVFADLVDASGLIEELGSEAFTCFAPTDQAIAALPPAELKALKDQPKADATRRWIKYHFIKSEACSKSDLGIVREIITWNGLPCYLSVTPAKMALNDQSDLLAFDLPARNGIIHSISKVLVPHLQPRPESEGK